MSCIWPSIIMYGKRNQQSLQHEIRHEVSVYRLYNFEPSKCHSELYSDPYVHLYWLHLIATIHFVFDVTMDFTNEWGISRTNEELFWNFSSWQNTLNVTSRLYQDSPVNKSWFQQRCLQNRCSVAWSRQNTDDSLTCIKPLWWNPFLDYLAGHPSSYDQDQLCLQCLSTNA